MESKEVGHVGLTGVFIFCQVLFWTTLGNAGMLEEPKSKVEIEDESVILSAEEIAAETGKMVLQLPSLTPPEISTSPGYVEHFCRELGGVPDELRISPPSDGSRLVKLICFADGEALDLSPGTKDRTAHERELCAEVRYIMAGYKVSEACIY